jgi:hypothetical protein
MPEKNLQKPEVVRFNLSTSLQPVKRYPLCNEWFASEFDLLSS